MQLHNREIELQNGDKQLYIGEMQLQKGNKQLYNAEIQSYIEKTQC
jgi:hypothetical protein